MKIEWNNKYTTIATYVFIVACSVILFYLSLSQLGMVLSKISGAIGILQPFIMGFSIAYILNFILKFFENKVINDSLCEKIRLKSKSRRVISIFITCFRYCNYKRSVKYMEYNIRTYNFYLLINR